MIKNICIRESYTDKQGEERVSWNRIGVLIETGDKQYVKLYHIPNVLASVFEPKEKSEQGYSQKNSNKQNEEEIPF
jgi:hypothetical protein